MHSNISEGLRKHDLDDLILPMISIDEFESKIGDDNEVIVVGFYALNKDPALDLSRFIDRSVEDILDTDISTAPTDAGYFMIFVEIMRDEKFAQTIINIVEEMHTLVNNDDWKFKVVHNDEFFELTADNLKAQVRMDDSQLEEHFEIKKFLDAAYVEHIDIVDGNLVLESYKGKRQFELVSYFNEEVTIKESVDLKLLSKTSAIDDLLGNNYICSLTEDDNYVIHRTNSKFYLILKD